MLHFFSFWGRHWAFVLTLASTALAAAPALAQTPAGVTREYPEHRTGFRCAFDSAQQKAFARQPGSETQYRAFLRQLAEMTPTQRRQLLAAPDVAVPVVVHIIHTGGNDNITDAQVNDAIRVINLDYSKTNADTTTIIPAFQTLASNVGFKFRLAKIDPNGNCTTGITRTYSTLTNVGDDQVKSLITWDQNRYLNVWVCTNANGAGGYAYLPCTGGAGDGIVLRNAQFGSIGTSGGSNLATRSFTHEIGHYFGLPHTWGGTNTPGLASNCGLDDGIADTPNTTGVQSSCSSAYNGGTVLYNYNPCGPLANVQNYMDYSGCTCMFTMDQKAVMRAALQLGCRQGLTTAANLLSTGTNDGYVAPANGCAPVVAFLPSTTTLCAGGTVQFSSYSYNFTPTAAVTYAWQFPGGTPATSSASNPIVTYPTGGNFDVAMTLTTPGGTTILTRTQLVQVQGATSGLRSPVRESFESATFPNNYTAPDLRNWKTTLSLTTGSQGWIRYANPPTTSIVVSDGAACMAVRNSLLPAGTLSWLTSPNIDLSSFSAANPPVLVFDRAFAVRPGAGNDQLQIQYSNDCGATWFSGASFLPAALNTQDTNTPSSFLPTAAADWQPLRVTIPDSYIGSSFQLRFQMTSRSGNTLFLDNVRLTTAAALATTAAQRGSEALRIFPNPLTAETAVQFSLPTAGPVALRLTDVLGRDVLPATTVAGRAGLQTLPLLPAGAHLAPGLYVVRVQANGTTWTSKVAVE